MRPHIVAWLASFMPSDLASTLAPTWFTCVGLAGVVTLFVMRAVARRHRLDTSVIASIVLWCYVAAVAAGIIVPLLLDALEQLVMHGRLQLRWAGMTSFWGYLAGLGAVAAVCRAHRIPLAQLGDLAAAPLGLALMFSRLGCFVAGCDYGKVTSLPWAVRFPSGSPAWYDHVNAGLVPASRGESLPVHPTELYEAALGVAIAILSLVLARTPWARRGQGRVFVAAAATYALGRIAVEACRGDAGRGIYGGLSSGQIFSLLVLATIGFGVVLRRPRIATPITAAALVLAMLHAHPAHAQPARNQPAPAPAPASSPFAAPPPRAAPVGPAQPSEYDGPVLGPAMPAPGAPAAPPAATVAAPAPPPAAGEPASARYVHVGVLGGVATPINRRTDQVDTLAGATLSAGLTFGRAGVWADLETFANRDASHGTGLLSASYMTEVATNLQIGARLGVGATLVNFKDPVFQDVLGAAFRFEGVAEYQLSPSWAIWVRPLSFDILTASALGGSIMTYQFRAGLAFRHGGQPPQSAASSAAPSAPSAPRSR